MEGHLGLEPRTRGLKGRCSNQLSYGPTILEDNRNFTTFPLLLSMRVHTRLQLTRKRGMMPKMQVRILQWNVWFKENIERVVEVLKEQDSDIICLQELTSGYVEQTHENTWQYIAHELGYDYAVQEIPIITEQNQWLQANAIFSRYLIRNKKSAWIHEPKHAEDLHDQYRGYLAATIYLGTHPLTVATTHMSFTPEPTGDKEVQELLALIGEDPKRFILTGDLNATPSTDRIAQLTRRLQHAGPPFEQNTWTTKPFHFDGFSATTLDWRYDYIFASRDLGVTAAGVVQTDVSDHLPVTATIEV